MLWLLQCPLRYCNVPSVCGCKHTHSLLPALARRFAPLRGASLALPEEEDFLAAGHAGSTIELLFGRPEWQVSYPVLTRSPDFCVLSAWPASVHPGLTSLVWLPATPAIPPRALTSPACRLLQEGWLGAELWDASRQLDAACEAYTAWQPAAEQLLAAAGQEEEDMLPETPRSRCAPRAPLGCLCGYL
jgi:hypothetical protein